LAYNKIPFTPKPAKEASVAEEGKTYVCSVCGQEIKVQKAGAGTLVCCNRPMKKKD
jgi:superoxide reductase